MLQCRSLLLIRHVVMSLCCEQTRTITRNMWLRVGSPVKITHLSTRPCCDFPHTVEFPIQESPTLTLLLSMDRPFRTRNTVKQSQYCGCGIPLPVLYVKWGFLVSETLLCKVLVFYTYITQTCSAHQTSPCYTFPEIQHVDICIFCDATALWMQISHLLSGCGFIVRNVDATVVMNHSQNGTDNKNIPATNTKKYMPTKTADQALILKWSACMFRLAIIPQNIDRPNGGVSHWFQHWYQSGCHIFAQKAHVEYMPPLVLSESAQPPTMWRSPNSVWVCLYVLRCYVSTAI